MLSKIIGSAAGSGSILDIGPGRFLEEAVRRGDDGSVNVILKDEHIPLWVIKDALDLARDMPKKRAGSISAKSIHLRLMVRYETLNRRRQV